MEPSGRVPRCDCINLRRLKLFLAQLAEKENQRQLERKKQEEEERRQEEELKRHIENEKRQMEEERKRAQEKKVTSLSITVIQPSFS